MIMHLNIDIDLRKQIPQSKSVDQSNEVMFPLWSLFKLYRKYNTRKVLKYTFLLISTNEKFKLRKILNIVFALNLSAPWLQFLIHLEAIVFNYKKCLFYGVFNVRVDGFYECH